MIWEPKGRPRTTENFKDQIITCWREGKTCRQISEAIGKVSGARFQGSTIERALARWRREGERVPLKYYRD